MCDSYIEITLLERIVVGAMFAASSAAFIAIWEFLFRDFVLGFF